MPYRLEASAFGCGVWPLSDEVQVAPAVDLPVVQCVQWVVVEFGYTPGPVWLERCVDWLELCVDGADCCCFFAWPGGSCPDCVGGAWAAAG